MKISALIALAAVAAAQEAPKLRLPGDVQPVRYELDLRLVPADEGYSGRVLIDVNVQRAVETIWLNSSGLTIQSATVGGQSARTVAGGTEFVGLAASVKPGRTRIRIDFTGKYRVNDVEGLFKQVDRGDPYVFTQFEPTSARQAFPCFDEPSFKTPWQLTLRVPTELKAFANTPVASEKAEGDLKVIRFAPSKPMPTYLVAMAVGPFDVVEVGRAGRDNVPVRTIALKGRGAETKYTNEVTPRIVAALEEYFGIPYPYEKLDQITIPITVGFGAMENAGLITYTQNLLLSKPEEDTVDRQRGAASVIAHEIAHQWFGNMVTPAWWDDIWLNEAFATWMANRIVGGLFPNWQARATAVNSKATVMQQDGLLSARRIRQPIEEHGDIGNAFDGITYQKGAAVIRMFEYYVGPDKFQRGVRAYMRKHAWGAATANDFLNAIGSAAAQNITPVFSKFLDRGGFPLLTVEVQCGERPKLAVAQERSLPLGSKGARSEYWPTPVCIRYEAGGKLHTDCRIVTDPRDEIPLRACPDWLTANHEANGYYNVRYKGDAARKLLENAPKLALHERVDLLNNTLALVRGGHMPAGDALALARQFRGAPERPIVEAALAIVKSVERTVPAELSSRYQKLIRDDFGSHAIRLGWIPRTADTDDDRLLRKSVVPVVATLGEDRALAAEAKALALKWLADQRSVPADIVSDVLEVAAYHGDAALFDRMIAAVRKMSSRRDRRRIFDAIGSFREPAVANRALALVLSNNFDIRELTGLLAAFRESSETEMLPWTFVKTNYDALIARLPSQLGTAGGSILPNAGAAFCSTAGRDEVAAFFRDRIKSVSGGQRNLSKVLEGIELCEARRKAQTPEVARYLRDLR